MNKKYRNQNTDKIWLKKQIMGQNSFNDIKIKFVEDVFKSHIFIMNT
jgi:hypothetical protein